MNSMQIPRFHLISFFVGMLVIGMCQSAVIDQASEIQTIDDGKGNTITLNITHTQAEGEDEEVIDVADANGIKVIEVDSFDGYYIEKPANSTDCLLTPKTEYVNENETCYNQTKHPGTNLTDTIAKVCKGRDIIVQTPCNPDASIDVEDGTEPSADRRKRSFWFRCYRYYYCTIRLESYCCRNCWGICLRRCWRYRYVTIPYIRCYSIFWG